jgi:Flp pilus assembly pilin Flp
MSGEKVVIYALITVMLVAILNQTAVRKIVKTMFKIGGKKLQLSLKAIKALLN